MTLRLIAHPLANPTGACRIKGDNSMIQVNAKRKEIQTETDRLVQEFLKKGGVIKVAKSRRSANSYSWSPNRMTSSVATRGRKANTLRNQGFAKSNS